MVYQTKKPPGFCFDNICADDTFRADGPDSPRTLQYGQSESREITMDNTDDGTGTFAGTVDYTLSAGTNSIIENQLTLDQNWTHEDVNRILGNDHHYRPALEGHVAGNLNDGLRVQNEVRPTKRRVKYDPKRMGWTAPLKAWLPARNLEIIVGLVLYNLVVVMVAAFTPFCGNPDEYNQFSGFCSEEWILHNGEIFSLIGVALFLLLAFRLNLSVSRFQESRRQLDKLESACRTLVRQICFHVAIFLDQEAWERRRAIAFVTAFPIALKLQLRNEKNAIVDLDNILVHQDILNLIKANSMPQFCIDNITFFLMEAAKRKALSEASFAAMENCGLTPMAESMCALDAINSSSVPTTYIFHLRFILIVWLLLCPLHLVAYQGFFTIIIGFLVDYIFLGLDGMACEFDYPFGYEKDDIDLDALCTQLDKDLNEILVRVEHQGRELIFDTWEVSRVNETMIYKATSADLNVLTSKQKVARQGRAQFVRSATKPATKSSQTDESSGSIP